MVTRRGRRLQNRKSFPICRTSASAYRLPGSATVINVHAARTNLSRLLDRVRKGEVIVLAKAGSPCAKLVPLDEAQERKPGLLKGWRLPDSFFEPLPAGELDAWEK